MKYNFIFITTLIFLTISQSNGQDFFKFSEENTYDFVEYSNSLSNGKIILQTMHLNSYYNLGGSSPGYEHFLNEFSDSIYIFNKFYLLNSSLSIEKELNVQSSLDSINWVLNFQIDEQEENVVMLVANLMADTTKFYMHWYNIDLELQHTLPLAAEFKPVAHWFRGWYFIVNENNNIVYAGTDGFYEFDKYGTQVNAYSFVNDQFNWAPSPFLVQNALGGYFSTSPQLRHYTSFSSALSLTEGVDYHAFQERVAKNCPRFAVDSKKENAYITGFIRLRELSCDAADAGIYRFAEFVYKYNLIEPELPVVFFVDTIASCNYNRYGQFAIDLHYDDHIYYSHSDKDCGFIAPPDADPTCFETYITLKCLDEEGNLRWEKYLGGDAAYLPQGVVATPDSGVVVFALRHHPNENLRYEADIYVAKFDKQGHAVELPDAGNNIVPVNDVALSHNLKVYPNPVNSYLFVEGLHPSYKNKIKLYNSTGQLVFNKNINSNKIDLSSLPKGYYTYAILNHTVLIKAGKILKW